MTALELLTELRRRGIRVWAEEGRLRYDAPKGALSDDLRAQLAGQRDPLLALLASRSAREASPLTAVSRDQALPLSFGQQRLWFLDQLSPEDLAYNVPATVRLQGKLEVDALRRAINEVVRRHETLRSHFPSVDGRATLVIEPFDPLTFEPESLDDIPAEQRLTEATRRLREDAVRSFDLDAGPLFRARLLRIGPEDHILHVVMHHIISDGWSIGVFFRELSALYSAFLKGDPSPLTELPIQYADFAHWQQSNIGKRGLDSDLAWWSERLGGELPTLDLPTDRPRFAKTTRHGAFHWYPIDIELHAALDRVGQREGMTGFQVMLSAFLVLLSRHTGQDDIVIGTPIAARTQREIEGIIGFFVNNLVLRGDLSGDPSFRDLLKRVRAMVLDAFSHQDTPFEKLVEKLSPERELGRNPLFQVLFNHFDGSEYSFELPPLVMSTVDMTLDVSKFDLTLHCFEKFGRRYVKFEYDTDLFDAETIQGLGERYVTLLRGIVADPGCAISRLPILADAERKKLLVDWNRNEGEMSSATSIHGLFEAQAKKAPDATALIYENERLTYAELDTRATALARRLVKSGVGPEVRVALFLDRSAELIIALLGVLKAGGAYVPIDTSVPADRAAFVLADSQCRIVLTRGPLAPRLPAQDGEVIALDGPAIDEGSSSAPLPAARPGQLAYVIYTSGSTGQPKGVEVEHAQLLHYLTGVVPRLDVPANSSYASVSTLAADLGNTSIFPALCRGGCLHLLSEERIGDGDAFANYFREQGIDVLKIVPSHLEALLTAAAKPADVLPRKLLVMGGEACTWELVERIQALAPHCAILNHYGPAETTVGALTHRIAPGDRQRFPAGPPIGRPIVNTRVYLVDAHLEPVPMGAVGELLIGGGGVTRGYRNQPLQTAARFIADPFRRGAEGRVYRTGDLARYTRDGQVVFIGRNDDQVKLRGFRVELGEVRACLDKHPKVASSAVLVRKDPMGAKRLVAYVVARSQPWPEPTELRAFMKAHLPDYMVPAAFVMLDALPLTPNGKLDRRALPAADFDRDVLREDYVPPRTPTEEILAKIWCEVLRLDRVGVHDNFFELGGESILSIQIISRANQAGVRLKPRDVFERATIAELAASAGSLDTRQAEQGPVTGPVPLTPVQHRYFDQDLAEPSFYNHAMLLSVQRRLDEGRLGQALTALDTHHDVLRLRYARSASGWSQTCVKPEGGARLEVHDLTKLTATKWKEAIETRAAAAQAALDIERGPLWRALYFKLPAGQDERLLLVVHHLAVDGVSWRLLIEDLVLGYEQLEQDKAIELPVKTTSFKEWSERLVGLAQEETTLRGAAFWLAGAHRDAAPLPVDHEARPNVNTASNARTLEVSLTEAETALLLREVPRAYRTQINEVLLTALTSAFAPWTGSRRLLVDLEGHGREDLFEDLDISRTVGWFTSVHPIVLDIQEAAGPGQALCQVKEQLRAVPDRGLGWGLLRWLAPESTSVRALRALPRAQIGFNYMGHFDQSIEKEALLTRAPESPGPSMAASNPRRYLFDVGGSIRGGRLGLTLTWCDAIHERATVEALGSRLLDSLRKLIRHCTTAGVGGRTPSDFPLAMISQAELTKLEERFAAVGIEDIYPLSPLQRGMVFHSIAEPDSSTYVTQLALTLHGNLSAADFQKAWQVALDANPILRTAFVVDGLREMHQVVCRQPKMRWFSEDWSDLPDDEQRQRLLSQALSDRAEGFDLAEAPLMRLRLIRLAPDRHRFVWTHHHALLDGWSLPLLVRDVFGAYMTKGAKALDARRPFSEYIRWLGRQDSDRANRHWSALLADWTEATPLPASALAGAPSSLHDVAGPRGILGEHLSQSATASLTTLARRQHMTLNTIVQGAWALLLARHAGRDEVLFGVTVSGRPPDLPGVETMLGLFINTLPLRVNTSDAPLLTWLGAVQAQLMELQQLQSSPLYEVQRLGAARGAGPLFESLVVFENYPIAVSEPVQSSGLRIEDAVDVSHATYPLALVVQPRQRLYYELRYDARRFDAATIHRLLQHLRTLLEAIASRPESTICQLPLISEEERRQQVETWNETSTEYPRDAAVPALFAERARATPDATAVVYGAERLTYAELDGRSELLTVELRRRGLGNGELVAIAVERGIDMVVGFLGILKAGCAYLPLDTEDPVKRMLFMLEDSGARCLVTHAATAARLSEYDGGVLLLEKGAPVIDKSVKADGVNRSARRAVNANDLAYVIYTSGSTGIPKGTRIPHRGITRLVLETNYVKLGPEDRVAQASNASFDAATFEIWGALLNGACVIGIDKHIALSPRALSATLREQRVTVLFVTTALFNQLVRHVPEIFGSLRYLLFGGEAVSPRWVREALERGRPQHLLHVYGPTECTTYSTFHEVKDVPQDATTVPIGLPIANSTAFVLDTHRQLTPQGAPGELYLGGDGLALGYHDRPELTAERFVSNPFNAEPGARLYKTGDLVRQGPDGAIEFLGRIDQQVKLRGFRVELGEIEEALRRQADVKEVVVICREDVPGDKELVAYVVAAEGATPTRDSLRAALVDELPDFMIPSAFVPLTALPLTSNGKIDKRALPAPGGRPTSRAYTAPHGTTEQRIAAIWRDVLGVDKVGRRDNFFDLGGHSLKLLSVHARLVADLGASLSITDLFQHTTVEAIARKIGGGEIQAQALDAERSLRQVADDRAANPIPGTVDAIAIVGMAGRFPGAPDIETFWKNLCDGVESVSFFTDEELATAGVPADLIHNPRYVKARAILDSPELFDARFFGYSPREAELMDPQQRLFLECAWEACERAGLDTGRYDGLVGVFAGASMNSYVNNLQSHPELFAAAGGMAAIISSINDFLTTRVSYKLNLRGPSVNVQTACSTSLVAVHEACQSLMRRQCDVALAGGVSLTVPSKCGYVFEESGVRSSDGHCRTFDAAAEGMVSGNGVAIVALKRLTDALADGDTIHAVIRGTAVNNDGSRKIGFTAPSIDGQAEVIAQAQSAAGVEPETIGYVECHGTATALGDPIEVAALTRVFRERTKAIGICALASLKSNMGHLDAAAGVAGLIKAALAVKYGRIPPSLHYNSPNPEIDFAASPFFVNTTCREWAPVNGAPRRAGVSAFGIGGTNAHAILEEPPPAAVSGPSRSWQVLQLSARSEAALDSMAQRLAAHLRVNAELSLADVAHTLRVGRQPFDHRRAILCRDVADAIDTLSGGHPERRSTFHTAGLDRSVAFLFPGQGAQYVGMGRDLYASETAFRQALDECFAILRRDHGVDLKAALYPEGGESDGAAERLTCTSMAQPALFAIEYSLAQVWLSWGVKPVATIGHSVGEFVSACLAGVMTLTDAIRMVTVRGRLMEGMPDGVMLAVPLTEVEIDKRLVGRRDLWLTGVNAPAMCVVGGAKESVEAFEMELSSDRIAATRLHTSHAFHSGLMADAVKPFVEEMRKVPLSAPRQPYVSTLTGDWVTPEQATDPEFWGRQIREPVRYSAGISRLLEDENRVLLELGPGTTLGSLARAHDNCKPGRIVLTSLRHARGLDDDTAVLLGALGRLRAGGVAFDTERFAAAERRRRIVLPTYPFERQRYWIERRHAGASIERHALDDWFYTPVWRPTRAPDRATNGTTTRCVVFGDGDAFEQRMVKGLSAAGQQVTVVHPAAAFSSQGDAFQLDPTSYDHARRLIHALRDSGGVPPSIVHLWNARDDDNAAAHLDRGFVNLLNLTRALAESEILTPVRISVLTSGVHAVKGSEVLHPEKAMVLGICRVVTLEHPNVSCRLIDLDSGELTGAPVERLVDEILSHAEESVVAWRGGRRFVEAFTNVAVAAVPDKPPAILREGGAYLVTGGLGGVGLALARALYKLVKAKLVLLGRTPLPERDRWNDHLAVHGPTDPVGRRIRGVMALEEAGAEVMVLTGDVSSPSAVASMVDAAKKRFGRIHGAIHAAGVPPGGIILLKDAAHAQSVLAPKVAGTRALLDALGKDLDVVVLCSSLNAVKGFPGASDYAAANAFLDAYARSVDNSAKPYVVSIAWNRWRESGMAVDAAGGPLAVSQGISDAEGMEVLRRVLDARPGPHVLISETELRDVLRGARLDATSSANTATRVESSQDPSAGHSRPQLATEFVAPSTELQRQLVKVWEELIGIQPIGIHDNFFDLGGHSLLAMRVLNRLSQDFGTVKLSLRAMFDAPTIAGLAARIESAAGAGGRGEQSAMVSVNSIQTLTNVNIDTLDPEALAKLTDDEVAELLQRLSNEGGTKA